MIANKCITINVQLSLLKIILYKNTINNSIIDEEYNYINDNNNKNNLIIIIMFKLNYLLNYLFFLLLINKIKQLFENG